MPSDPRMLVEKARQAVAAETRARAAHEQAIEARNNAIREAWAALNPPGSAPNHAGLARTLGLTPSTVRAVCADLAKQLRRAGRA